MSITLGIIKTDNGSKFHDELISSIKDNIQNIDEVIFTGSEKELISEDLNIKYLNLNTENKAIQRNAIVKNSSSDYILWISNSCELDFDFVGEFLEILEEFPDADIIYPNQVVVDIDGKENIIKYDDFYGKELNVVLTLRPEKGLPEYGVLTKKELFDRLGGFDENFEDFEFYDFLWKNIKNIRLKHSKFSFIINKHTDTFVDTSFHSKSLRENIKNFELKELFPLLQWDKNENLATSTAYHLIADALFDYYDMFNASEFYRKSAIAFHNKLSVQKLVNTYYAMGLFDEALSLLREDQGFDREEIEEMVSKINQIKSLIENIEQSVSEGKIREILGVINDIYSVYQGAPVVNIIGVVEHMLGNKENAFRFFYKAATLNPLAEDVIQNLTDTAKELGREEKVKRLFERLLG